MRAVSDGDREMRVRRLMEYRTAGMASGSADDIIVDDGGKVPPSVAQTLSSSKPQRLVGMLSTDLSNSKSLGLRP